MTGEQTNLTYTEFLKRYELNDLVKREKETNITFDPSRDGAIIAKSLIAEFQKTTMLRQPN